MGRLIRTLLGLTILASIASAIAAAMVRERMVSKGEPIDDEIDLVAIFRGLDFRSRAMALRRARVTSWYGGATLDLREATIHPEGASIELRAAFGGLRLVVPDAWRVEQHLTAIFGGVGDTRDVGDTGLPGGPLLTIEGFALFGGVGIVSDAPDLDDEVEASAELPPLATA
ncbi:MAG: hypothetical protein HY264_01275 [Chloroflexi bacterium]|nr:hypothetical protein [Chloroflexota bacterium]